MVITKQDRVAAVLKQDESLIDVFTALSPAFERLRNPAMRRVMSRLVTVEQAARMAGVDADVLIARLNGDDAAVDETRAAVADSGATAPGAAAVVAPRSTSTGAAKPAALAAIPAERIVVVDVRDDLRRGQEPFSRIMAAKATVPAGGALAVRAIFEPVPLYAVLRRQGLSHYTQRIADDDWQVWFFAAPTASPESAKSAESSESADAAEAAESLDAAGAPHAAGDVVVLDVRGLEPPEPMVRTLGALESLPEGGTLVQLNVRVPRFLLPLLAERGFTYEVREQAPDLVRVFIRRTSQGEE